MQVILIGASPLGSLALARLGVSFVLVVDPHENVADILADPIAVFTRPYQRDPLSILTIPLVDTISGVLSFTELGLLPAALLSEALNLPTVPVAAVLKTRNKWLMRQALSVSIAQPKFGLVTQEHCHLSVSSAILKPIDGVASEDIHYLANGSCSDIQSLLKQRDCWLWEEYLDGGEYSIETVTSQKTHYILGVTEKITSGPPHFVEMSHIAPARLPGEDYKNIKQAVCQCLDALNMDTTAAHIEIKYARPRTSIIEIHTRPGGGRIPLITELVSGYSQHEFAIRTILHLGAPEPYPARFQVARVHFFHWRPGQIAHMNGLESYKTIPGIIEISINLPSDNVIRAYTSNRDRVGFAVVGGTSYEELEERIATLESKLKPVYMTTQDSPG